MPAFAATTRLEMGFNVGGGTGMMVAVKVRVKILFVFAALVTVTVIVAVPRTLDLAVSVSKAVLAGLVYLMVAAEMMVRVLDLAPILTVLLVGKPELMPVRLMD